MAKEKRLVFRMTVTTVLLSLFVTVAPLFAATTEIEQQRQRFTTGGITLVLGIASLLLLITINGRWRRRLETKNRQLKRERNIVLTRNKQLAVERDRAEKASQAKTAFMQSMTHEIRTPLNAISGFTQLLTMPGVEMGDEQRLDFSNRIQENTNLLTKILDDMIQIADLESSTNLPEAEDFPAVVIASQAVDAVMPQLAKNNDGTTTVSLSTDIKVPDDLIISTHPRLLLMALGKLLDNAAKFTAKGSITLSLSEEGDTLLFSVIDTGPGIPESKKDYVFDRFTKLDSFVQGTGLGLSVARMIAERLGGSLTLDTDYKDGAKFDLRLPKIKQ